MLASEENNNKKSQKILTGAGIFLCVVLGFLLICNLIIIVKGTLNPDRPPSVFGTTPMVVLSGSMSGDAEDHIETGDLIFVDKAEFDELKTGDVIAFMNTGSKTVTTHRIITVSENEDGEPAFITKGDANNVSDAEPVTEEMLVGRYKFRIPKVGDFALFLHKPLGMLLFIGVPLLLFIIYDIVRRQKYLKTEKDEIEKMRRELEKLRSDKEK